MRFLNLSFKKKLILGFATILVLFTIGLGMSLVGMNAVSDMLRLSNETSSLVATMLKAREHEKDFLISKNPESEKALYACLDHVGALVASIESITGKGAGDTDLSMIKGLLSDYRASFSQTVSNTRSIDEVKTRMREASAFVFDVFESRIRAPILDAQNMALITGEDVSPAFGEILKTIDPMILELKDARFFENAFIMYDDPSYVDKFVEKIAVWEKGKEDLLYLVNTSGDDALKQAFKDIDERFRDYNAETIGQVFDFWNANKGLSESMGQSGGEISSRIQDLQAKAQGKVEDYKSLVVRLSVILLLVGLILGTAVTFFIIRSVTLPLNQTIAVLKDIARGKGDLTARIQVKSRDEIGSLAHWFNMFLDNLRNMIQDITGNADTLGTSSKALASISKNMTEGFGRVSSTSGTMSRATREMSEAMDSATCDMKQASMSVDAVVQAAAEINSSIHEIVKQTENAKTISAQAVKEALCASENINQLGSSTQQIEHMTATISGISEQTNLLALNATIEAARAGEAGKGFAVVANEIKELARQAHEATETIKESLGGIQDLSLGSVSQIETITRVINEIDGIVSLISTAVKEQSQSTEGIAGHVSEASDKISQISATITQSSQASGKIASDISDMDKVVSEVSSSGRQVNTNASELSSLAESLQQLVGRFRV